jgi:class 3 adenylate cyclase
MCILGTLGNDERIDGTIIGDSVNVASRLEGLCGKLGADIIISANTLEQCRSAGLRIDGMDKDPHSLPYVGFSFIHFFSFFLLSCRLFFFCTFFFFFATH